LEATALGFHPVEASSRFIFSETRDLILFRDGINFITISSNDFPKPDTIEILLSSPSINMKRSSNKMASSLHEFKPIQ